ncbi:MAG: RlmE family RNA methyltransferase [Thermoplasmata archaeon]|nr:RlmE family RNA methyltransferase [Thermoplasmata archaeon]
MTRRWQSKRKKEYYYRLAKKEKYRSRAAYKLKQIIEKFDVIHTGDRVIDLGASPGGWSQISSEIVGATGKVIGADIKRMRPIEGVEFVLGDIRDDKTIKSIIEKLGGSADVVISDMSPNISGNYSTDHARSIELCEYALGFAKKTLREGGSFVVKVFEGDLYPEYFDKVKREFRSVKGHSPKASRASSSEIYIIAKGFIGTQPPLVM